MRKRPIPRRRSRGARLSGRTRVPASRLDVPVVGPQHPSIMDSAGKSRRSANDRAARSTGSTVVELGMTEEGGVPTEVGGHHLGAVGAVAVRLPVARRGGPVWATLEAGQESRGVGGWRGRCTGAFVRTSTHVACTLAGTSCAGRPEAVAEVEARVWSPRVAFG